MNQVQNNIILPSLLENNIDGITVNYIAKDFNVAPVLKVILEDFNRPQEFVQWLKLMLKADKKLQKLQTKPRKKDSRLFCQRAY